MNFKELSNDQLRALLETANAEDCITIQSILDSRREGREISSNEGAESPLTRERVFNNIDCIKMSDAELKQLEESLQPNVGHTCQVSSATKEQWDNGVILGTVKDNRRQTILYTIKLDNGKRTLREYNSDLIKLDPINAQIESTAECKEWNAEDEIEKHLNCVGKLIYYDYNDCCQKDIFARVVSIVANKGNQSIVLRLQVPTDNEGHYIKASKVYKESMQLISDELTEDLYTKYVAKRHRRANRKKMAPSERVRLCEENLSKAEVILAKAKEVFELRKRQLMQAQEEMKNSFNEI